MYSIAVMLVVMHANVISRILISDQSAKRVTQNETSEVVLAKPESRRLLERLVPQFVPENGDANQLSTEQLRLCDELLRARLRAHVAQHFVCYLLTRSTLCAAAAAACHCAPRWVARASSHSQRVHKSLWVLVTCESIQTLLNINSLD